jgi:hypothetical protein
MIPDMVNIQKTMENHHFQWENSLFLWQFSIAMFDITRGYMKIPCAGYSKPWIFIGGGLGRSDVHGLEH